MTWNELQQWAELNGFRVTARAFRGVSRAVATLVLDEDANGEENPTFYRRSTGAAKRALCRWVERVLEAVRA